MKRNDKARIMQALIAAPWPISTLSLSRSLCIPNPANRISDLRRAGAPITDKWRTWVSTAGHFSRFKLYSVTSKRAARQWLKRNEA